MPEDFAEQFYSAILTYRHQLVFDPRDAVSLNSPWTSMFAKCINVLFSNRVFFA